MILNIYELLIEKRTTQQETDYQLEKRLRKNMSL